MVLAKAEATLSGLNKFWLACVLLAGVCLAAAWSPISNCVIVVIGLVTPLLTCLSLCRWMGEVGEWWLPWGGGAGLMGAPCALPTPRRCSLVWLDKSLHRPEQHHRWLVASARE